MVNSYIRSKIWATMITVTCMILLAVGCNPTEVGEKSQEMQQAPSIKMQAMGTADPSLEGGAENQNRVLQPMSNQLLQQRYPNVLLLHGTKLKNQVALTFDDGPDRRYTPMVLDVLNKYNVKATFFLVGARVAALPEVTRRIARDGHAIGNHTYWHPALYKHSPDRLKWEVTQTDEIIQRTIGVRPKLFRAPYGGLNQEIVQQLKSEGYSVIGWDVDTLDWKQPGAAQIADVVLAHIHPGAIILMHSAGHWTQNLSGTAEALDTLIPELKRQGLQFVTIPQMIQNSSMVAPK
jgi:peptidoglycan/xylan/chitin deacetylase (PgdA/CDA1 family)